MSRKKDHTANTDGRQCEWPKCAHTGEYRAPKDRSRLREYYWFCLEHVRDYNKKWNYFEGMSGSQFEALQKSRATWNRPTWPLGGRGSTSWQARQARIEADLAALGILDEATGAGGPRPGGATKPLSRKERKALNILELDETATLKDVKKRFKQLVKRFHPDTIQGADGRGVDGQGTDGRGPEGLAKASQERLRRIIEAYSLLRECSFFSNTV